MITLKVLENGNLRVSLTGKKWMLKEAIEHHPYWTVWGLLLEDSGLLGNGWSIDSCDNVGGLSEAPCFLTDAYPNDDGYIEFDKGWWFPDYQVCNDLVELYENGFVDFVPLPE